MVGTFNATRISATASADRYAPIDHQRRQSDKDKKGVMTATEAVTSIDEFPERLWPWPTLRQRQRTLHGKTPIVQYGW
jgi:hypothetical protein